jgi:hypothetical protein
MINWVVGSIEEDGINGLSNSKETNCPDPIGTDDCLYRHAASSKRPSTLHFFVIKKYCKTEWIFGRYISYTLILKSRKYLM